jgi:hypothetical protein
MCDRVVRNSVQSDFLISFCAVKPPLSVLFVRMIHRMLSSLQAVLCFCCWLIISLSYNA